MNYFVSCIYGDYDKYFQIKKKINLKSKDKLWILGDVLDGNDDDPESCIEILNDIMENENIELILGDHEYARCMEYSARGNAELAESWRRYSNNLDVSGAAFNDYASNSFTQEERDLYFGEFLLNSCELSSVIPIENVYYIYAVHGKPSTYAQSILNEWQLATCSQNPDFKKEVFRSIKTDEFAIPYVKKKVMTPTNTIAVVGQMTPAEASKMAGLPLNDSGVFFANKTLVIGRHFPDEPIPIVGIDTTGYQIIDIL